MIQRAKYRNQPTSPRFTDITGDPLSTYPKTRAEALALGVNRYFEDHPCTHGHSSPRRTGNAACLACHKERHGTPEARAARKLRQRVWRRTTIGGIIQRRMGAVRKRGREVTVTNASLEALWNRQDGKCAVTGIPMTYHNPKLLTHFSLDRENNALGYTVENVRWVCLFYNLLKQTMADVDVYGVAKMICDSLRPDLTGVGVRVIVPDSEVQAERQVRPQRPAGREAL